MWRKAKEGFDSRPKGANKGRQSSIITESHHGAKENQTVNRGRVVFILCLCFVAIVLGFLAYHISKQSEENLATKQFASISDRALTEATSIFRQRGMATLAMASMVGQLFPDPSQWPFVVIPRFEQTVEHLLNGRNMGFIPLVEVDELADFEEFAYDYYYNHRYPEPFPNNTVVYSFGRGVWGLDPSRGSTPAEMQYHDTTGETSYGSPYTILTPVLQADEPPNPALMFNMHSTQVRGIQIDGILDCVKQHREAGTLKDSSCGAATEMLRIVKYKARGPATLIFQPIFPIEGDGVVAGLIPSALVLDEVLENVFADTVSGVRAVVHDNADDSFTFEITNGVAHPLGDSDLHNSSYAGRCGDLTDTSITTNVSVTFSLCLYPTDAFFDVYSTNLPKISCAGAVLIIVFTSLLFFVYDLAVRKEFNNSREVLEAKRKFMRFVSHEVRTPLNSVCMGLTLIQKEIASSLGYSSEEDPKLLEECDKTREVDRKASFRDESLEWLQLAREVKASATQATDILSDFLNYDKIENGKFTLEFTMVSIEKLVQRVVNDFHLPAAKKRFSIDLDMPEAQKANKQSLETEVPDGATEETANDSVKDFQSMKVIGDQMRLLQVMQNLLSNAIKFTPEGGSNIRVNVERRQIPKKKAKGFALKDGSNVALACEGEVVVSVRDSGAGMTEEQLATLFGQGVQFNVNDLQAGQGSGLGLYISKGITNQHGGSLIAKSDGLGHGSCFQLTLPLYRYNEPAACHVTESTDDRFVSDQSPSEFLDMLERGPLKRILVVDDVSSNRRLLVRLLEREGYDCDQAENGKIALEMTRESLSDEGIPYDAVLLDSEMPVMNGPDTAKAIRNLGCSVLIIGITGNVLPEDVAHFRSCGADTILSKPLDMKDLKMLLFSNA